jgi:hypothetical protein
MRIPTANLRAEVAALKVAAKVRRGNRPDLSRYRDDPVGYARDILGVVLWERVADAIRALLESPFMVSIDSGHGVGKTHAAAVVVNWWYDTRDPPEALRLPV